MMKLKNQGLDGAMTRDSVFSYHCKACGRCCYNKQIAVNPYEALRLAGNRGMSTGEFVHCYLAKEGPYLRVTDDGNCVFQADKKCSVHADRPLPCRTYPLGRWVSSDWEETFRELQPHPQCEGIYGEDGTVMDFLKQQGALPYMENADRYQALFYRLFDALQEELPSNFELAESTETAMFASDGQDMPAFMEWLDVEKMVENYCQEQKLVVPSELSEIVDFHIKAIDQWLNFERSKNHE